MNLENELHDIYPMVHVPFWQTSFFFWLCCAVVCMSILVGVCIVVKRVRERKPVMKSWEHALAQLQQLHDVEHADLFYARMTMIMKEYIQQRFELDAVSKTDQEMTSVLRGLPEHDALQKLFHASVEIKFAQADAGRKRMQDDLIFSQHFINLTIPTEPRD